MSDRLARAQAASMWFFGTVYDVTMSVSGGEGAGLIEGDVIDLCKPLECCAVLQRQLPA